jgi:hypothetical protein
VNSQSRSVGRGLHLIVTIALSPGCMVTLFKVVTLRCSICRPFGETFSLTSNLLQALT